MRSFLPFIFIASLIISGCATASTRNDDWFSKDKAKHFIVSSVISGTITAAADNHEMNNGESFSLALGVTLSIGAGKETYDLWIGDTGWSWRDITWDLLGALAGYCIVEGID
jgi:putative lipoprotein